MDFASGLPVELLDELMRFYGPLAQEAKDNAEGVHLDGRAATCVVGLIGEIRRLRNGYDPEAAYLRAKSYVDSESIEDPELMRELEDPQVREVFEAGVLVGISAAHEGMTLPA